ncbi:MAG: hypothetical protein KF809_04935 [Chloroflexi bacterium]|nr:hypothetical protein [Chloroflexota bacterium]
MSSNISQSYPSGSESEVERAAAVATAIGAFEGLGDKLAAETTPLGEVAAADHGAPARWWVWVCPKGDFNGRLHVAGYARDRHALYTVCDTHGDTYLR